MFSEFMKKQPDKTKLFYNSEDPPTETSECREIGSDAVWTLSSAKQGNGIEQIRDKSLDTFWQSDGQIPHNINIQFMKKTRISFLAIFLDYQNDESYTPSEFKIRGGMHMQNLQEICRVELREPNDWFIFPLTVQKSNGEIMPFIYTMNLQIVISRNHLDGQDSHVRAIQVYGPEGSGTGTQKHKLDMTSATLR